MFKNKNNISYQHKIREELKGIILFLVLIWGIFLLDRLLPLEQFGLVPRDLSGAIGILTMPFLHADFQHLIGNSVPLIILLCLLAGSRVSSFKTSVSISLLGGVLLWLFGRTALHIGASGLIFGLMTFLIFAGYFERRVRSILIAVLVGVLYGGTLLSGMLPRQGVSWDGHLFGALAGFFVAYLQFHVQKKK